MPYRSMPKFDTGLVELGDGIYAYLQWDGGWGVSNAGFVDSDDDGLLVIDALMAPSMTQEFVRAMRTVSSLPFSKLINTHSHADHTNGNQFIEGAEIIAHQNCRNEMLDAEILAREAAAKSPPRGDKPAWIRDDWWEELAVVRPSLPAVTYGKSMSIQQGEHQLTLEYRGEAHTTGDSLVLFADQNLFFSGDLCFFYATPLCRGNLENWIDICDYLLESQIETVVPGHGPIGGSMEIADMREYFEVIRTRTRQMFDAGVSLKQAMEQIDVGEFAKWPESERNAMNVAHLYGLWDRN